MADYNVQSNNFNILQVELEFVNRNFN